jgi:hypothetical protein
VFQGLSANPPTPVAVAPRAADSPLDYDLNLAVHGGTLWPTGGTFAVSDVAGKLRLRHDSMEVVNLTGRRGGAEFRGSGRADWKGNRSELRLAAGATNLALEPSLYAALPAPARKAWDEVQPQGTVDLELNYDSAAPSNVAADAAPGPRANSPVNAATATVDARSLLSPVDVVDLTAPVPAPAAPALAGLKIVLRPRDLSLTLKSVPYKLDKVTGTATVLPDKVVIEDFAGRHGNGTVRVAGTGLTGPGTWDLKLAGHDLDVDDALRKALPPALAGVFDSLKLTGRVGFMFPRFVYHGTAAPSPAPAAPTIKKPADATPPGPDIDLGGAITLSGATLDVGVPLKDVEATFTLKDLTIRDGRPAFADGDIVAPSLTMAGRALRDFHADLSKPLGRTELRLDKMEAKSCGGVVGGNVLLSFPDVGPSRYALNLAVRNADVAQLAQEPDVGVKGQLTASLALEGASGAPSERRGRGDVVASGHGMVRVPLVLGLMQVTNLAVPLSGPFNEATARYSVEGQKIVFENMELRSDNMVMSGDGSLDFGTRQVRMSFVTDNPRGLKVPFLNDLLQGARQELLKIHVNGTIQEPKVSAGMMSTFTTTIDQVVKGDPPPARKKK